jgi:tellurite resistance protein TerC
MNEITFPWWAWTGFGVFILLMLSIDLGLFNRKAHVPTYKETLGWSIVWVSLALIFNVLLYFYGLQYFANDADASIKAWDLALKFLTGYLIELSLSVDNLFVFLLVFAYFKVPKQFQHRVLFWGVLGALIMRIVMIFIGAELIERFHWIIYIFGAFLVYTGIRMFREEEAEIEPEKNPVVRFVQRFIPITHHYDGDKFFTVQNGKRVGTLLFLVLVVVEVTDLVFAVDSIPAIFGITTDRFIVYTSNVFAILGLRTFFFLLANVIEKFHFLRFGLAFVLAFIGIKMLLPLLVYLGAYASGVREAEQLDYISKHYGHISTEISLGVVATALVLSVILSLIFPQKEDHKEHLSDVEVDIDPEGNYGDYNVDEWNRPCFNFIMDFL